MKLKKFKEHLERHGTDLRRWPEAERFAARAILDREPKAAEMLERARPLDSLLDSFEAAEAGPSLADNIAATALRTPQTPPTAEDSRDDRWMMKLLLPQLAGLAAAALLGMFVGWTDITPASQATETSTETLDLSDLVFGEEQGEAPDDLELAP